MSYQTLYRKFRPQVFDDVFGQDHIVTALRNQIASGRIGHAYLFTGTRGTGKTTVAKIFAKVLNCENPVDGNPCGKCASCKSIASNSSLSVIEIDGASNNGIDNIRNIIEEVSYPPVDGKYKVYIIDEVHAISANAFQALLKTLEEPPRYVIFILATTEVGALPITILSRCQRYDFHRISVPVIEQNLRGIVDKEGIEAEDKALRYIARLADGSMRDGLSILDQGIAFSTGESLSYERMLEVLGAVDTTIFSRLLRCILSEDTSGALWIVDEIIMEGKEPTIFATDFVWYLRSLLLAKSGDNLEDILDISSENQARLYEESEQISENSLMRYIQILSDAITQLKYSNIKRVVLEISVIRLCKPQMQEDNASLIERIELLEKKIESGNINVNHTPKQQQEKQIETNVSIPPESLEKNSHTNIISENSYWGDLLENVDPATKAYLKMAKVDHIDEDSLSISFDTSDVGKSMAYSIVSSPDKVMMIKGVLAGIRGKDIELKIEEFQNSESSNVVEENPYAGFEKTTGIKIETEDF